MNIQTITEPQESAKAKLKAYRAQLHRRADAEYQAIAQGYEALARGLRLLDLGAVMRDVECDEKGRPRLAIARADRRQVMFHPGVWWNNYTPCFDARADPNRQSRLLTTLIVDVRLPERSRERAGGYALVPLVPADVVDAAGWGGRMDLSKCSVLWEVEEWADRPLIAQPDRDPYLLRHLGGDLYSVIAEWDLTELERAVMAGRREG